ncbi:MAG: sigma-70 family RNA polymerase sigma factor [Armatimonadetes bacterium]|nr:sigma-70 family RNA polymerase sigma factor [Armatimonadota bacterium]
MDDRELARSLQRGEPHAFEALVEGHYDALYRFLRHLSRHRETAEDLTQQALLKAVRNIGSFRGESSLKSWLHRIALREFTGWRRKRRLWLPLDALKGVPEPAYGQVDEAESLLALLHGLPTPLREALLLFHVQGLSVEEIALVTGAPVGTVKSRLHHARKRLQSAEKDIQESYCYEP